MNTVESQVGAAIERVLGLVLVRVEYLCLPHEAPNALAALELDGEIALRFEANESVYLTWNQVSGWNEVNSLVASIRPQSKPESFVQADASSQVLWSAHVGSKLCRAEVLGWSGTPAIARLAFSHGSVLIGVGYEAGFRDGDCILARADDPMWLFAGEEAATLWSASA